jgi:hypothetical protein
VFNIDSNEDIALLTVLDQLLLVCPLSEVEDVLTVDVRNQ